MSSMQEQLKNLKDEAITALKDIENKDSIMQWRSKYTGRTSELASVLKNLKDIPQEQRKDVGQLVNAIKKDLESMYLQKIDDLNSLDIANESSVGIDISLPGIPSRNGGLHPITIALNKTLDVLSKLGFSSLCFKCV